jgi:hypothetical protein
MARRRGPDAGYAVYPTTLTRTVCFLEHAALVTKEAGLKEETIAARYKLALADMESRIDRNTSNISILQADYDNLCVEVMNDPEKRGRYWSHELARPHQ